MARASRTSKSDGMLHGAGKWVTAGLTTAAMFLALLVNAKNLGLDAWLGSMGLGFADARAARVSVIPRVDSLFAIGDSLGLAATVTDGRGAVLVGASLVWRSEDTAIASVDTSGVVVARGPGTTRVTAMVRDLMAGARITVHQVPVAVRIPGDSVMRVLEGDSVPLRAYALDARGQRIRDAAAAWRSSDTTVTAVDSSGVAVARTPGRAVLTATLGPYRARVSMDVALAPTRLELLAGGDQRAPAGRMVAERVALRVVSRGGIPVPAVPIGFRLGEDEGALDRDTVFTDRAGRARIAWTLGPRPGRQRLMARVEGLDSTVTVTAEADPVRANTRIEPDSGPAGRAGQPLAQPITVRVTDSTGAALADVPVTWTAQDGGAVEPLGPRTDSLGQAAARWTLGPKAGRQRVRVQVGNPRTLPPVTISVTAAAGEPVSVALVSGQGQRAVVGRPLGKAVVAAVRDAEGNPVSGVELTARPVQGTVADSALTTDAQGRAAVRWSLGRATGLHRLELRAAGVDSTLVVTARARAGSAANIAFRNPPARATVGTPVRIAATVTDAYGNPVGDALVLFAAGAGSLSATRVMSDTGGAAVTRWTPGSAAGEQTVSATIRGTSIKATHAVRVAARR